MSLSHPHWIRSSLNSIVSYRSPSFSSQSTYHHDRSTQGRYQSGTTQGATVRRNHVLPPSADGMSALSINPRIPPPPLYNLYTICLTFGFPACACAAVSVSLGAQQRRQRFWLVHTVYADIWPDFRFVFVYVHLWYLLANLTTWNDIARYWTEIIVWNPQNEYLTVDYSKELLVHDPNNELDTIESLIYLSRLHPKTRT